MIKYFLFIERKKSELSQGILVNSPTRLAGDDCEQTKNMFDFGITTISKPGGFYTIHLKNMLWVLVTKHIHKL